MRGLAHLGVLKVLERESIQVNGLAGTSMGGVIAAGYAAGLDLDFMEQEAQRLANPRQLLSLVDRSLPRRGLFVGERVRGYLSTYLGERTFADLHIPLTVMATDLNSGRPVQLCEGSVVEALRASIAVPGVFAPVDRGDQLLVDGGLLDNLPAGAVRQMGADVVIAVDVRSDERTITSLTQALYRRRYVPDGLADTIEVLGRSVMLMMTEISRQRLAEAVPEVIIRPDIPAEVSTFGGMSRVEDLIVAGERATLDALPAIHQAMEGART
jgi:NTE family protein